VLRLCFEPRSTRTASASRLKTTPDFTRPMWDTTHAVNFDTGWSGCATPTRKMGKMIRNQVKLSVRIDK
jgi:hypothetical protein